MWLGVRSPRQNASALCQLAKNRVGVEKVTVISDRMAAQAW